MPEDDLKYFFGTALTASIVGGLVALAGNSIFGLFAGNPLMLGLLAIIIGVLIVYSAKWTDVDSLIFAEWIVLFLMVGGIGTVITGFFPAAAPFILSSVNFTVSGLGFTVLYILIAHALIDKLM